MKKITGLSTMLLLFLMSAWTQMFAQNLFVQGKALKASELESGMEIAFKAISVTNTGWVNWSGQSTTLPTENGIFILEATDDSKWKLKRRSDSKYIKHNSDHTITFVENAADATALDAFTPALNNENSDRDDVSGTHEVALPQWAVNNDYQIRFADSENFFLNVQHQTKAGETTPKFAAGRGSWSIVMVYNATDYELLPFMLSEAPQNGKFSEQTYWHYLKIDSETDDSRYAAYTETENQDNQISLYATNPVSYGSFWAFVKTDDGKIQIYNAATGTSKVLTVSDEELSGGNNAKKLKMQDPQTGTKNAWEQVKSDRGFHLFKLTDNANTYYVNHTAQGSVLGGNVNATGAWSDLMFEFIEDFSSLIETVRSSQTGMKGAVGSLSETGYADFTEALDKGTAEGLAEALKIRDISGDKITFDPGKYYYIYNGKDASPGYISVNSQSKLITQSSASDASQIFHFATVNEETYHLQVQGEYVEKAQNSYGTQLGLAADASNKGEFQLAAAETGAGVFRIKNTNSDSGTTPYLWKEYSTVAGWSGTGNGSQWYLIEVPSINVTISDARYATVNYPFAVRVPEGVTAYTGSLNSEKNELTLKAIEGGIIPANTPAILEGDANVVYTLNIVTEEVAPIKDNALSGVLLGQSIALKTNAYILGNGNSGVGFYQMSADDRTLGSNKAYLELPASMSHIRSITIGGPTTGIEDTVAEGAEAEEYYDLQGRRVLNPVKGIYVTKSGKKVIFNK